MFGEWQQRLVGRHPDMLQPLDSGGLGGLYCVEALALHVGKTLRDPVDMLLDRHRHVGQDRRAAGAGDGEQVRKSGNLEAEIIARPGTPDLFQGQAMRALDVELE